MHDNNTSNRKGILVITKGAVEVLLDKDEHQKPLVSAFERKANEVANEGYRVIYAIKEMRALPEPLNVEDRIFINLYRVCRND
jgi:Ca2+-transporting ATPase